MFPIEAFRGTVERFIGILRSLEIRHHLTGGVVSVAWGESVVSNLPETVDRCLTTMGGSPAPACDGGNPNQHVPNLSGQGEEAN